MSKNVVKRLVHFLTFAVSSILLSGCGQGDGPEPVPGTPQPPLVGVLIDSPVSGVTWERSSGESGITDAMGQFEYMPSEQITFSIGGIVLGTVVGADYISMVELTNSVDPTTPAATNQLVFLQSIDEDGDPSNGIQVSASTASMAAGQSLDFTADDFATQVMAVVTAIRGAGTPIVGNAEALNHFYTTYSDLNGTDTFNFLFPGYPPVGTGLENFTLVFADEFEAGTTPNPENWNIETGYGPRNDGWGNNEWQLYTSNPENVRVEDGNLVISALCATPPCGSRDGSITSARITTQNKFNFKFGKIVARIKPPVGTGVWPAFWALGANLPEVGWPRAGEIDFMEIFNTNSNDRTTHSAMHWCDERVQAPATCSFPDGRRLFTDSLQVGSSLGDGFHIWEANWNEERITVSLDGVEYFSRDIEVPVMDEFLEEFFMILNVAMGGTLGSDNQPPDGSEVFPQTMLVDYVRVFQSDGATSGGGSFSLPIDFEDDAASYVFDDFEGGAAAVIDNPQIDANNDSAQVGRMLKFNGAPFAGSLLNLPSNLSVEADTAISMKVWSPRPVMVLLKLEGETDAEVDVAHSGSGWEELVYDFGSYEGEVEGLTFIFDNGTPGAAMSDPDNWTFYFDDIALVPVELDTTAPTITAVSVASNNSNAAFGVAGDTITLSFTTDEPINTPIVTINGVAADAVVGMATNWQAGRAITADDAEGPVTFSINYSDLSGNAGVTVEQTTDSTAVAIDATAPSVVIEGLAATANMLDAQTLTFKFSEAVTGFELDDIIVSNATLGELTSVDASTYTVELTPTADGEVQVSVEAGAAIDVAGNQNTAAESVSLAIDSIAPMLMISGAPMSATSLEPIAIAFQFSEMVTGFDANDLQVINGTVGELVMQDGANYSTTVTPSGDGELTLSVAAGVVQDAFGNVNMMETGFSVLVDTTVPTVEFQFQPIDFFTTLDPISFTFQFSEAVTGFELNDILVTNGEAVSLTEDDAATYTAEIEPNGGGDLVVSVAAGAAQDGVGNNSLMSDAETILIDPNAPTVMIEGAPASFSSTSPFNVTIRFSEPVEGFELNANAQLSDIRVTNGAASQLLPDDTTGAVYTADITPNGIGNVTIEIPAGVANDAVTNPNEMSNLVVVENELVAFINFVSISSDNAVSASFATAGDVITIVMTPEEAINEPTVTIGGVSADVMTGDGLTWRASRTMVVDDSEGPVLFEINFEDLVGNVGAQSLSTDLTSVIFDVTPAMVDIVELPLSFASLDPIAVTLKFDEDVSGFDSADITVTNGSADAGSFVAVSASEYTVDLIPDGSGDLLVTVAEGVAQDSAGIANAAANFIITNAVPSTLEAVSIASNNANPLFATIGDVVTVDFTANEEILEPVVDINEMAADVVNTGLATWQASRTISATEIEGPVTFTIDFANLADVPGDQVTMTTDDSSVTVDRTGATVTINDLPTMFTTLDPIAVTFQFSEDVTGFDETDIDVTSGTAADFATVDASTYTANITPMEMGDLTVAVAADAAVDIAGNGNIAASVLSEADLQPFWQLVWSDDFEGAALDGANWTSRTDIDCPTPCESGEQSYSAANNSVANSLLSITAQENAGPAYVSGFIDSRGKREFKYGRVEIDAQMPATLGTLPSLMLLPVDSAYGAWPASGEIDIVNAPDLSASNVTVEQSLVYGLPEPETTATTGSYDALTPPDSTFITYAIEWEAGEIRWFVDDVHVLTQTQENWYSYAENDDGVFTLGTDDAPFNENFYLALNVAVTDSADGSSSFPQTMQVDAVRVYECAMATDPLAGTGCSTADPAVTPVMAPSAPYEESLDVYVDGLTTLDFEDAAMMTTPNALVANVVPTSSSVFVINSLDAVDPEGGTLWNLQVAAPFGGGATVDLQPTPIANSSAWFDLSGGGTAGEILFRMKVNSASGDPVLEIGMEDRTAGVGKVVLPYTADGVWRDMSVKISDLVTASVDAGSSLDIANISSILKLIVDGGTSFDVSIDDIEVKVACRDAGGCQATPRLASAAVVVRFTENFDDMDPMGESLENNWIFFNNVFQGATYLFGYGPQPAPNGPQISALVFDQGGPTQGTAQLSVYSDYECCQPDTGHNDPSGTGIVEVNLFQEETLTAADLGKTITYSVDVKRGNIADASRAYVFIKVLDPNAGFSTTIVDQVEVTNNPIEWGRETVEITIGDWEGQILQYGFQTTSGNFENSGMFFDNVEVTETGP